MKHATKISTTQDCKLLRIALSVLLVLMLIPATGLKGLITSDNQALADEVEQAGLANDEGSNPEGEDPAPGQDEQTSEEVTEPEQGESGNNDNPEKTDEQNEDEQKAEITETAAGGVVANVNEASSNEDVVVTVDFNGGDLRGTLPTGWTKDDASNSASKTYPSTTKGSVIQQEWANQTCVKKEYKVTRGMQQYEYVSEYVRLEINNDQEISTQNKTKMVWKYSGSIRACSTGVYYTDHAGTGHITEYAINDFVSLKLRNINHWGDDTEEVEYECTKSDGTVEKGSFVAHLEDQNNTYLGSFTAQYVDYSTPGQPTFKTQELKLNTTYEFQGQILVYVDAMFRPTFDVGPHGKMPTYRKFVPCGSTICRDQGSNIIHITFNRYDVWGLQEIYDTSVTPDSGYTVSYEPDIKIYPEYDYLDYNTTYKVRFYSDKAYAYPSVAQGQSQMGTVSISDPQPPYTISDNLTWSFSQDNTQVIIDNNGTKSYISATPTDAQLYEFDRWEVKYYDGDEITPGKITQDIYTIAHFKTKKYTATFDLNEGTLTQAQENTIISRGWTKSGNNFTKIFDAGTGYATIVKDWEGCSPSKDHYVFSNWAASSQTLKSDTTFTAKFNPEEYTLTAQAEPLEGQTAGTAEIHGTGKVTYADNKYTITNNTIAVTNENGSTTICNVVATANTGYKFKEWKINDVVKTSGDTGNFDKDTTLTAVFEYDDVTVGFTLLYQSGSEAKGGVSVNGGSAHTADFAQIVSYGSTYEVSNAAGTEDAYVLTFKRAGQADIVVEIKINETPYAGYWRDAKGNFLSAGDTGTITSATTFKAGFYNVNEDHSVSADNGSGDEKGTVTLNPNPDSFKGKAKWVKNQWSEQFENTLTLTDSVGKEIKITAKSKFSDGYSFICWGVDGQYLEGESGEISENTTFTAYFARVDKAKVSLSNPNVGTVEPKEFECPTTGAKCMYNASDKTLHVYLVDSSKRFWEKVVTTSCRPGEVFDEFKIGQTTMVDGQEYDVPEDLQFTAVFHTEYVCTMKVNGGHITTAGVPAGWKVNYDGNYQKSYKAGVLYTDIQNEWVGHLERDGYTFNGWFVEQSGTAIATATTMWANWNANTYNLTINKYIEGTEQPETETHPIKCDQYYSYDMPVKAGYTCDTPKIEGFMPAHDLTVDVYYTLNTYKLTINYICNETGGQSITQSYQSNQKYGSHYVVESPSVKGYVVKSGQETIVGDMPANDVVVNVDYTVARYTITLNSNDTTLGTVSPQQLVVWAGTKFSVDGDTITFTFPDQYPGEKTVTVKASTVGHGVFIDWTCQGISGEIWNDDTYTANFEEGYLVKGQVKDKDTKTPIANATVYFKYTNTKLVGQVISTITDENGIYALPAILKIKTAESDLSTNENSSNANEDPEPTTGYVYCAAPAYEGELYTDVEITRDCDETEPLAQIELKVYSGIFVMNQSEGNEKVTIDWVSPSGVEKHVVYSEPVKVGACQGDNITSKYTIDGDKVYVDYVDRSAPETYADQSVFTAVAKEGYVFDSWTVTSDEPANSALNAGNDLNDGLIQVNVTYTFTPNYKYVGSGDRVAPAVTSATSDKNSMPIAIAVSLIALAGLGLGIYRRRTSN